jgi:glutamyl-tRNA synthetase
MTSLIRTRIAPSPTGNDLHIGNLYTALINWAFAKKKNGKFIIRIEDTDQERLVEGAEKKILSSLRAFGLDYDEGPEKGGPYAPYKQSQRLGIYKNYIDLLIKKGHAYYCFCTKERLDELRKAQAAKKLQPRYDRNCLVNVKNPQEKIDKGELYVVRLKVPDKIDVDFFDLIRGKITIKSGEIDDQVLLKSDGYPTYHFGVVIDDHLMEITHIIRAEEWIVSTPKHVLLYKAFGWDIPVFAHLPILRNPDRSKLSKRKNPVWASWYLQEGYLPEAVLNYLMLLGWSHPKEKEIFSISEFTQLFDLKDIHPAGPIFDLTKLTWMNQQYILRLSDNDLRNKVVDFYPKAGVLKKEVWDGIAPLIKTRMMKLKDFIGLTAHFFEAPLITVRNEKDGEVVGELLLSLRKVDKWEKDEILKVLKTVMQKQDIKMPLLYYIFTGQERGLPLPESLEIIGQSETLRRVEKIQMTI